MDKLHNLLEEVFAKSGVDPSELDDGRITKVPSDEFVPECATIILEELRRGAPKMLREHRKLDKRFRSNNFKRWARGFDLLEMLIVIAEELGDEINNAERPGAASQNDARFEAVVTLHARAILVAREIFSLLKRGFSDGALSRWRTLHEIAVISSFLSLEGRHISERFLLSRDVRSYKAMKQYQEYHRFANMEPFGEQYIQSLAERYKHTIKKHGSDMRHDWGWAAPLFNKNRVNLFDIERGCRLDHWRPRYKWASQDTHGDHRSPAVLLGMSEASELMLVVGPSNSGFTDPAHMMAISLNLATSALGNLFPTIDRLVVMRAMTMIIDEIGEVFLSIDRSGRHSPETRDAST